MRALVQRVKEAAVRVDGSVVGSCGYGLLVLLGVTHDDTPELAKRLADKLCRLRIFEDEQGKTNLSLTDVGGELLVVSQFTLYADCKRGLRPSFTQAAQAAPAEQLYEHFCSACKAHVAHVDQGSFGAMMDISLIASGPFSLWLDTDELFS